MAKLHLKYMIVHDTQEWPQDEVYMKIDGRQVWSEGSVAVGDTLEIYKTFDITGFSDKITLFEDDWWPNGDEDLGSHTVNIGEAGLVDQKAFFTQAGANYELVYDVTLS
ncbi:MAG TPA: hypothetical protein V6C91_08835 [Coleofasciculaceae cyanobacterium]